MRGGMHRALTAIASAVILSAFQWGAARAQSGAENQAKPGDPLPQHAYFPGEDGASPPKLIRAARPRYTDEARKAKYDGVCLVQLIVDSQGVPRDVLVKRGIGMGLDQSAVEAVRQERFEPATWNGHHVAMRIVTEVSFKIDEP